MKDVEATRLTFRPERITTLFVGESAPVSGDFFYFGNTALTRHMQTAIEQRFGPTGNFLETFKALGWYLDDLVLTPVNQLRPTERRAACVAARSSLAQRIAEYQPLAIVSLLHSIREDVAAAASTANSAANLYTVPFPGMGQQVRFQTEMKAILPLLPNLPL
jgi:hypothetical protein